MMYIKSLPLGPVSANCYIIADEITGEGAIIDPGDYTVSLEREIAKAGNTDVLRKDRAKVYYDMAVNANK